MAELLARGDNSLPWHSPELREEYNISSKASFILHIGVFEKNMATSISSRIFSGLDANEKIECEQRLDQEGSTCFAKVPLNSVGAPAMKQFSISSLPWALGHLDKLRFTKLDSTLFKNDCNHLADELELFSSTLKPAQERGPGVLRANDILALLMSHLVPWADFEPKWQYVLQIDWVDGYSADSDNNQEDDENVGEDLNDKDKHLVLPILNSFYFEDIEKAHADLKINPCRTLKAYLTQSSHRNPDLYSQDGIAPIINKLHPRKMPLGRWPSQPENAMSLMQQFAINTAIDDLSEGGILSVNGPPGTGKTTLLRDIIAHNLVERATKLSSFNDVEDTIDNDGFIVSALTGFEMIIASSNNSAVENISKELPQLTSLAKEFQSFDYILPVANQMAAEYRAKREFKIGKNGEGKQREYYLFHPLEEKKKCWGLISVALGKKSNRDKFSQRLLTDEHFLRKTSVEKNRPDSENFLSLWRWKFYHNAETFISAKNRFTGCLRQSKKLQDILASYSDLLSENNEELLSSLRDNLTEKQVICDGEIKKLKLLELDKDIIDAQIKDVVQRQDFIESEAPGIWARLFNRQKMRSYREKIKYIQAELLMLSAQLTVELKKVAEQRKKCVEVELEVMKLRHEIEHEHNKKEQYNKKLSSFQQQFSDVKIPDLTCPINDAELQRVAYWQDVRINRQRSQLFIAAMQLHQAWLYEALGKKRFSDKIYHLGRFMSHPHLDTAPIKWWQTLSMFVPVLSTTFASVGRMLNGVKGEEIGWLMIDEAGQASPQQAVGAIWRAKRVLVVGDPLQIEPVFTTSPALVKHLCEDGLQQNAIHWNPGKVSVQQVVDRSNRWGCTLEVMNTTIWIGIPLWVHRRCIEPMFSLSNAMAYNSRMIHGLETKKIISQPINGTFENHWLISRGGIGDKQYRDSHGKSLLKLLDRLLLEHIELQSIFIITPFKAVKYALLELISQRDLKTWKRFSPLLKQKDIDAWKKKGVGTIHTFQGKENDVVILVLGCDEQDAGGAKWASGKPNLLNVALTRAKKHIFIIGDPSVWYTLPGFDRVAKTLPEKYVDDI